MVQINSCSSMHFFSLNSKFIIEKIRSIPLQEVYIGKIPSSVRMACGVQGHLSVTHWMVFSNLMIFAMVLSNIALYNISF